ncbi:tetratricopeptide repeat protein [Pendulispora rubella]|uniref:Tetratricopeptide repeat protein n=1 Tax=Pendulispora rubella TaxID=2741070 RepID=A0ABZ2LIQ5_9BACT
MAEDEIDEAVRLLESADELRRAGRLVAALEATQRALERLRLACGDDHPDVASALLTLGKIHEDAERYTDAEATYLWASEIMRRWIDEPDPTVQRLRIQVEIALGHITRTLGRLDVAHAILTRAVTDAEHRLGPQDPDTGAALNALGMVCKYAGRFGEGQTTYRRALDIAERTRGPESTTVATICHNLGGLAFDAGDYAEAEPPARRAVEIRRAVLGDEHPDVAADRLALAPVLEALGRVDEAAELYARVRLLFERTPGREYDLAVLHNNLGVGAAERGDTQTARHHYVTALVIKERLLGEHHADLAMTLHNLGMLSVQCAQWDEARTSLLRALRIFEASLPPEHPKTIVCRTALASIFA